MKEVVLGSEIYQSSRASEFRAASASTNPSEFSWARMAKQGAVIVALSTLGGLAGLGVAEALTPQETIQTVSTLVGVLFGGWVGWKLRNKVSSVVK
jgi:hypothetical protein